MEVQAKLPHHVGLLADPIQQLWKYYSDLGCVILLESKLIILVSVPLSNRDITFEIYQVLNLPLPYPKPTPRLEVVARYKVETEFLVLNIVT